MIFLLKFFLALVGLVVIASAIMSFFAELTETIGSFGAFVGVAIVFLVFQNEAVADFLNVSMGVTDDIAFGAFIGGSIILMIGMEKLGSAMITMGWVSLGLILLQVIPIPFIANLVELVTLPFTVACLPLLLIILIFV